MITVPEVIIPEFRYPGGKGTLAPRLVELMPKSGRYYVEPFSGRCNIYFATFRKLDYQEWRLNDLRIPHFPMAMKRHGHLFLMDYDSDFKRLFDRWWHEYQTKFSDASVILESYIIYNGGSYRHYGSRGSYNGGVSPFTFELYVRNAHHILKHTQAEITGKDWKEAVDGGAPLL